MRPKLRLTPAALAASAILVSTLLAPADLTKGMVAGDPGMKSIGPLAFGPEGILFAADPKGAAVFAFATGATKKEAGGKIAVAGLDAKVAGLLGTTDDEIIIQDLAVDPLSKLAYLSVSRGKGPDGQPAIVRVVPGGKIELVPLDKLKHSKLALTDAPKDEVTGEGRRRGNKRLESVTDLAYVDGKIAIAGLSNEEFASTLRTSPFPFESNAATSSIEIYHGAHGKRETHAPIRTFLPMIVGEKPVIVASYTCTPLVTIPVADLRNKIHVKGKTVAELGNRNRPLDMIEYDQGNRKFILIANSARGVMKVSTEGIEKVDAIEARVERGKTAGLPYDTIKEWEGIVQLDKLGGKHALVIRRDDKGLHLEQRELP